MKRITVLGVLFVLMLCPGKMLYAAEQWQGVDEAVVQKIAKEHGREAKRPLIDSGEGDLPLFAFLVAGAIGGFAAGYYWRVLLEGRKQGSKDR